MIKINNGNNLFAVFTSIASCNWCIKNDNPERVHDESVLFICICEQKEFVKWFPNFRCVS